jgi:hypothetical protein
LDDGFPWNGFNVGHEQLDGVRLHAQTSEWPSMNLVPS